MHLGRSGTYIARNVICDEIIFLLAHNKSSLPASKSILGPIPVTLQVYWFQLLPLSLSLLLNHWICKSRLVHEMLELST